MELTTEQVKSIIATDNGYDPQLDLYYEGKQAIFKEETEELKRIGVKDVIRIACNLCSYVVDQSAGFMLSHPVEYKSLNTQGLEYLHELYEQLDLNTMDFEHFKQCLVNGISIEVIGYQDGEICIEQYSPSNWWLIEDECGDLKIAIYKTQYYKGDLYQEEFLSEDIEVLTVYTEEDIIEYRNDKQGLRETDRQTNLIGIMPVVVFYDQKNKIPLLTKDVIKLQDAFNSVISSSADVCKNVADAILYFPGFSMDKLVEPSSNGLPAYQNINLIRMFANPGDTDGKGTPSYITKTQDVNSVKFNLDEIKQNLHMTTCTLDYRSMTDNTGNPSGIAMKIKYQMMQNRVNEYKKYFEKCLRKRIDIINEFSRLTNSVQIDDLEIIFTDNMPLSDYEVLPFIDKLKGLGISPEDIIDMLAFIRDKETIKDNMVNTPTEGQINDTEHSSENNLKVENKDIPNKEKGSFAPQYT